MSSRKRAEEVFYEVMDKPPGVRAEFLRSLCGTDVTLRAEVEALLAADSDPRSVGRSHAADAAIESAETLASLKTLGEGAGDSVGPYKLLQQIGEGGFGAVFMAEQRQPVQRKVALKIIKPGMDTRQVIARFEQERQALAMMDHPNVARVLDAGSTESGRPYFVMELVRGDPITEYCDRNKLAAAERLDLFIQVCHAVQHAHQKGIIHRDIKPNNILVTIIDGRPVPKIIDFGIAKATAGRLTERTLFTEFRQFIGTPQYMSPEQAEMSGVDVDTRSDIYSLGVLLYELLTGTTPFDPRTLRSAAYGELQRIIREVEPPRPSTRVNTLAHRKPHEMPSGSASDPPTESVAASTIEEIARHRHTDPLSLSRFLRGDLDWIVMKCLEKDRTRRYDTVNGLALDIKRHLDGEPVVAAPPSVGYKLRKFIRRNRTAVTASCAILAVLVIGLMGTTFALIRANVARRAEAEQRRIANEERSLAIAARDEAKRAQVAEASARAKSEEEAANAKAVTEFLQTMLASVDPTIHPPGTFATEFIEENYSYSMLEDVYRAPGARPYDVTVLELLRRTIPQIEAAAKDRPLVEAIIRDTIGRTLHGLGVFSDANQQLGRAMKLYEQVYGLEHPVTLRARVHNGEEMCAYSHNKVGSFLGPILPLLDRVLGPEDPDTLRGKLYFDIATNDWPNPTPTALQPLRQLVATFERTLGPANAHTIRARTHLSSILVLADSYGEAEALARQSFQIALQSLGADHSATLGARLSMAKVLNEVGKSEEALTTFRESRNEHIRVLGLLHEKTLSAQRWLMRHLRRLERWPELLFEHSEFVRLQQQAGMPPDHPSVFSMGGIHAQDLALAGDFEQAHHVMQGLITKFTTYTGDQRGGRGQRLWSIGATGIFKPHMRPVAIRLVDQVDYLYQQARAELAPGDRERVEWVDLLGGVYTVAGRYEEARNLVYEAFLELADRHGLAADGPARSMFLNLVMLIGTRPLTDEDLALVAPVIERAKHELADNSDGFLVYLMTPAMFFNPTIGQVDRLLDWAQEAYRQSVEKHGEDSEKVIEPTQALARLLHRAGRAAEALELQARAVDRMQRLHSSSRLRIAEARAAYGLMLAAAGRHAEARQTLLASCKIVRAYWDPTFWPYFSTRQWAEYYDSLANLLDENGEHEHARQWREIVPRDWRLKFDDAVEEERELDELPRQDRSEEGRNP